MRSFEKEIELAADDARARAQARVAYEALVGRYHHPAAGDAAELARCMKALEISKDQFAKDVGAKSETARSGERP